MSTATRDDQSKWGKIGHPVQSRGLSPKDRTPWVTLIITALSCLGLGKAFLVLQANYETEGASWAAADAGVKLDSGGELGAAAAGSGVRRAGGGLGAADAAAVDLRADVAANDLGSDAAAALSSAKSAPVRGAGGAAAGAAGTASPLDGVDASCNAELNLDLDGPAVSWGLDFKTETAAECCEACKKHTKKDNQPGDCNSWVWCPEPLCWSPDIWNHTKNECWLKVQDDPAAPKVNHRGDFAEAFRTEHKTAPPKTPWMAGVLLNRGRRFGEHASLNTQL